MRRRAHHDLAQPEFHRRLVTAARSARVLRAMVALLASGVMLAWSPPTASAARSLTVRTNENDFITRIGNFRTQGGARAGVLSGAIKEFGSPSSRSGGGNACAVKWRRLKVTAQFVNYGGGGGACGVDFGRLQTMVVKGERFRTTGGVRVGMPSDQISEKHPDAEFRQSAWWITSVYLPYGDGYDQATIKAIVSKGKVRSFKLWIGAGGE